MKTLDVGQQGRWFVLWNDHFSVSGSYPTWVKVVDCEDLQWRSCVDARQTSDLRGGHDGKQFL